MVPRPGVILQSLGCTQDSSNSAFHSEGEPIMNTSSPSTCNDIKMK